MKSQQKHPHIILFELLNARFSLSELKTLCLYLGIEADSFPQEKPDFPRELIRTLQNQQRIPDLLVAGKELKRTDVDWDQVLQADTANEELKQVKPETEIKAADSFVVYDTQSRELIKSALGKLKQVPANDSLYRSLRVRAGSVLASLGDLESAKSELEKAREQAADEAERAAVDYNLFQVHLQNQDFESALTSLQQAIAVDTGYALHNVDKYTIKRLLGAGGMGCVFLCHNDLHGDCVVKCLWQMMSSDDRQRRDLQELLVLKSLRGYAPEPLDHGNWHGHVYLVTEYIAGTMDGEAWLEQHGPLNLQEGLSVGIKIAEGLNIAHQAGICHLDLKPANILLKRDADGKPDARIIDFGLSGMAVSLRQDALTRQHAHGLTQFGKSVFGTINYAPPEQMGDSQYKPSDRSDVYSFALTLYRLMTNRQPPIRQYHLPDEPALQKLLWHCIEEEPQHRPAMDEVAAELKKLQTAQKTIKKLAISLFAVATMMLSATIALPEVRCFVGLEKCEPVLTTPIKPDSEEEARKQAEAEKQRQAALEQQKQAEAIEKEVETLFAQGFVDPLTDYLTEHRGDTARADAVKRVQAERDNRCDKVEQKFSDKEKTTALLNRLKTGYNKSCPDFIERIAEAINTASPKSLTTFRDTLKDGSKGPEMVWLPGTDNFTIGSPENEAGRQKDEDQKSGIKIARFAMGKYEVTRGQFRQFVTATNYRTEAEQDGGCYEWTGSEWKTQKELNHKEGNWQNVDFEQTDEHPVLCVSWNDAIAYTKWLSEQTGQTYRLPTEAEWEYAARGGTSTARYWGEEADKACAYANVHDLTSKKINKFGWTAHDCDDKYAQTSPVGAFKKNEFELHDVLGNVWEWTCSEYNDSYNGNESRCTGKKDASRPVLRGGSWDNRPDWARSANRGRLNPSYRDDLIGFRLARI